MKSLLLLVALLFSVSSFASSCSDEVFAEYMKTKDYGSGHEMALDYGVLENEEIVDLTALLKYPDRETFTNRTGTSQQFFVVGYYDSGTMYTGLLADKYTCKIVKRFWISEF